MKENHNTPESGKLIAEYGAANLVFAMEIDCFDEVGVMMGAIPDWLVTVQMKCSPSVKLTR